MNESKSNLERVRAIIRSQYFWGIVAIFLLLLINLIKDPSYLNLSYNPTTGAFVGNIIDILRAAAPILMIAVGVCLPVCFLLSFVSLIVAARAADRDISALPASTTRTGGVRLMPVEVLVAGERRGRLLHVARRASCSPTSTRSSAPSRRRRSSWPSWP